MPDGTVAPPRFVVRVAAMADRTSRIRGFELVRDDGDLPPFEAGAHLDLLLGDGVVRSYSLANDPRERHRYVIAVLREPDGRGSGWMHDRVRVGDVIEVSPPRNAFPLEEDAAEHVLLAGGVGITPILSMAYRLEAIGARFRILYCTRNAAETAFREELLERHAERLLLHHDEGDPALSLDLAAALRDRAEGAHLYVCGPKGLINAARAASAHWPPGTVHVELFASPTAAVPAPAPDAATDAPFEVEWSATGQVLTVPADRTMLDVLLEAGIKAPHVCKEGWCGNCRLTLLSGRADHRDEILEDDERAAMDCVHSCVSRALPGERLVVSR